MLSGAFLMPLAAALMGGCLCRPSLVPQCFTFSTPSADSTAGPAGKLVLAIRRLTIAAPFAGQSLVYRTGAFSYEQDPYAQFLVPPEESLAEPLRAYFRQAGIFDTVAEPGSAVRPDFLVEISLTQLYGDFSRHEAPTAVLAMRLVFFDAPNGLPGRVLSDRSYRCRIPLKARTAGAVMAGWDEALKKIVAEAASEVKTICSK